MARLLERNILLSLFLSILAPAAPAQDIVSGRANHTNSLLNRLDLEVTAGTTGLGLNLSTNLNDIVRMRAGVSYFPHDKVPMSFDLMSYGGDDADEETTNQRFEKLSAMMEGFTGVKIDRQIDMHAHGTMADFRLLLDVYPFAGNRHWYATAGFYWGSRRVGHIENTIWEAPSLMGVIIYDNMYDYFMNDRFFYEPFYGEAYLDPEVGMEMKEKFARYGRLGAHVGDFVEGSPMYKEGATVPYLLKPDADGTIRADMYVNSFKPYLGIGYDACVSRDGRWNIGFDAGALFWGKPKIYTHERYIYYEDGTVSYGTVTDPDFKGYIGPEVNLATDVTDIAGKAGEYCRIAKAIHVYPVLNLKISYKLF